VVEYIRVFHHVGFFTRKRETGAITEEAQDGQNQIDHGPTDAEIEPASGAVVQAFTTGTVVQVFLLGGDARAESWNGNREQVKEHASSADDHSQDADRHSKTRHVHSQK